MPARSFLDDISLIVLVLSSLAFVFAALEVGFYFGKMRSRRPELERPETVGTLVAAALGLVAFLLALTFSIAASRFEEKRRLLNDEVNTIGTTYLRADFLEEPARSEIRRLLREYVSARLLVLQPSKVGEAIQCSETLHQQLWQTAVSAGQPVNPGTSLFFQSLNQLIDLHTMRVIAGLNSRIPDTIWIVLLLTAAISLMASGYQNGMTGRCQSPLSFAIVVLFAIVIGMIMDMERTQEGTIRLNHEAMMRLREALK